jgi:fatty-acyl-CoA synthase
MEMHSATAWEAVADTIPDFPALSNGAVTRCWAEFDDRAARLASAFVAAGLRPDSKVALYLFNGNEYLEALYGAQKMRGVAVNVNYRYLDEELAYILDNSDTEALVFHTSLGDRVGRVVPRLPNLKLVLAVDDGGEPAPSGTIPYEQAIASHEPMRRIQRPGTDHYMLYTGGTTGMPKGVVYENREHTGFFKPESVATIDDFGPLARRRADADRRHVAVVGPPLMHGTGLWLGATSALLEGGHVVTLTNRHFDAHEMLAAIAGHRATRATIVGDAFARPLITAIDEAADRSRPYDLSSLRFIQSSGVMWTAEVKQGLVERIAQVTLIDAMGSTEGTMGTAVSSAAERADTARFTMRPTTRVFDSDDVEIVPGSDQVGLVGTSLLVPVAYYKDPEKSARTFRTIEGVRYSFPGDMAKVAADGSLILLGRGSNVINSAGEKIFPEEVEEAVKRVDGVVDCLVVGVDDEKFGQAVTAVASLAPGSSLDESAVITSVKLQLAGYKAPKRVVFVDHVPRAVNGKPDYAAARRLAAD